MKSWTSLRVKSDKGVMTPHCVYSTSAVQSFAKPGILPLP
eukprot:CAMPEP_0115682354 /NCGR_PEP_ID=MMETSP0272-20121206/57806_1 /TAXON_ID=71861 /ORGANISM="Scrippsiella trochoidea, Strain CCMP3099" /LENGTH=39 /DNA_ID= /DNA_START= /DNA_END= /DNA_ORIENTATION=